MATVKFKNDKTVNLSNLIKKLPTITYINVSEYLNKTKPLLINYFL